MTMRNVFMTLRGVLVLLGFLITASAQAQAPKVDRAAEKATVEQTFRDYAATFWTGDPKKVTTFYNDPMMLMPAARVVTSAEVETWVERIRENGRSRGIADAVLERLEVKMVGDGVALVSFIYKRLTKEGAVVETGAGTYYLRKTDGGWKIAVIHAFPVTDFVKLD
jgi:ketosteroid isomerase-like protein